MSGGRPIRVGITSGPLPPDLPRLSRGRSGSVTSGSESTWPISSGCFLLLFFSTGRSETSAGVPPPLDLLPAVSLESRLWSVGRPASGLVSEDWLELVLAGLAVEFAVSVPELASLALSPELLLWSVGRSGSGACACPPEPEPAPVPEPPPEPLPLPVPPAGASSG